MCRHDYFLNDSCLSNVREHLGSTPQPPALPRPVRGDPLPAVSVDRRSQRESSVHVWFLCQPLTEGSRSARVCPASMQVSQVWVITRNRVITGTQDPAL